MDKLLREAAAADAEQKKQEQEAEKKQKEEVEKKQKAEEMAHKASVESMKWKAESSKGKSKEVVVESERGSWPAGSPRQMRRWSRWWCCASSKSSCFLLV
jgi:hypothetical protein